MKKWNHIGAILAGGKSQRMGQPKEGIILWNDLPMIEHIIETLLAICKKVVIIGEAKGYNNKKYNLKVIPDKSSYQGPLLGVETLLESSLDTEYLITACDQPLLTPELLSDLTNDNTIADLKLFRTNPKDDINPFPGIYNVSLLPNIKESIQNNRFAMHLMIKECSNVSWIELPNNSIHLLHNINTKEDLEKIKKLPL